VLKLLECLRVLLTSAVIMCVTDRLVAKYVTVIILTNYITPKPQ